jgi:hypothetical protein
MCILYSIVLCIHYRVQSQVVYYQITGLERREKQFAQAQVKPKAMRTSDQYVESLRDGREVYFKGQRVPDVTAHPEIQLAIEHAAIDFAMAERDEYRALAVYEENGKEFSRYFKLPRTPADLLLRSQLIETATTLGGTLVVLIKEIGTDALFALHLVAHEIDKTKHTGYLDRVRKFYDYASVIPSPSQQPQSERENQRSSAGQ